MHDDRIPTLFDSLASCHQSENKNHPIHHIRLGIVSYTAAHRSRYSSIETMIASKASILVFLSALIFAADSFVVQSPMASRSRCSTWMVDAPEEEGSAEETAPQEEGANDILNSPEFLRRKMDVLKSDLEQAEKQLESEKLRYEDGKAEWGEQFDELAKEVSC